MSKFHDEQENLREEEVQDQGSRIATEISIKNKTKEFDNQVVKLTEEAVKCTLEYGEDHYMTEMMVMFLEMALAMKEAIRQVTMSQVAISTIQRAMGVVQESLRFNDEVMSDLLSVDMGFMARFRRKRKMRKSIRNMRNSIVMTFNEVMGFSKLAQEISEELQDAMERMQASNRRAKRRRQKRQERAEKLYARFVAPCVPPARPLPPKECCFEEIERAPLSDAPQPSYAAKLLEKLQKEKLAPADRLEADALSRTVAGLGGRPLTEDEARILNDCLSSVLRLTAKYKL